MIRPLLLSFILLVELSASAQLAQPRNAEGQPVHAEATTAAFPKTPSTATITHRIIDAPNGTFGYEILADGKLLVRQTNVPGRPGNNGCATKAQAEQLAELVITKIRNAIMPPAITREELSTLRIIP